MFIILLILIVPALLTILLQKTDFKYIIPLCCLGFLGDAIMHIIKFESSSLFGNAGLTFYYVEAGASLIEFIITLMFVIPNKKTNNQPENVDNSKDEISNDNIKD